MSVEWITVMDVFNFNSMIIVYEQRVWSEMVYAYGIILYNNIENRQN